MKKLSLSAKMYLTLVPLTLMGAAVTLMTWISLRENATPLIQAQRVKELAVTSLSLLLTQDDASKAMMLDPENPAPNMRKIKAYDSNQAILKQIRSLSQSPELAAVIDQMQALDERELRPIDTTVLETLGDEKPAEAKKLYFEKYEPARARYELLVKRTIEIAEQQSAAAARNLALSNSHSLRNIVLTLAVGMLLVAAPLFQLARLTSHRLKGVVERLKPGAQAAAQSSTLLTDASHALSKGAGSSAASLRNTSAALGSLTAMLDSNNERSHQAQRGSDEAMAQADIATAEMERMTAAMEEIKSASAGISKIIKVIDEIAFQTNILALNAAVEAARAGEAGLGFSIVADEVRNLAQRSTEAARETASLIEAAVQKSQQGLEITGRVGNALISIVDASRRINQLIAQTTEGSRQQTCGIQEISAALDQVEGVTQDNVLHANNTAKAAHTVRNQARSVNEIVEQLIVLVEGA
jgi:methyl-accepting chemotaxis protein